MPKIITAKRREGETDKAREYVKVHILLPSSLLGLVCLVAGTFALVYQFFAETYSWRTLLQSTGLMMIGGVLGWGQTRYHQYLLREHPGYFAGRLHTFARGGLRRSRRGGVPSPPEHEGQRLVPLCYLLGVASLVGAALLSAMLGQVYFVAAFLLPWAGFFWAKTFFWRRVLGDRQK